MPLQDNKLHFDSLISYDDMMKIRTSKELKNKKRDSLISFKPTASNANFKTELRLSLDLTELDNRISILKEQTYVSTKLAVTLPIRAFTELPAKTHELIFRYIGDVSPIYSSNATLQKTVINSFKSTIDIITTGFSNKYNDTLKFNDRYLIVEQFVRKSITFVNISLKIVAKIMSKELCNKTVKVGHRLKYENANDLVLKNVFKFDVFPKKPLSFWLIKEKTLV